MSPWQRSFTDASNVQTAIFNVNSGGKTAFSANSTGGMGDFNINPRGTPRLLGHFAIPQMRGCAECQFERRSVVGALRVGTPSLASGGGGAKQNRVARHRSHLHASMGPSMGQVSVPMKGAVMATDPPPYEGTIYLDGR